MNSTLKLLPAFLLLAVSINAGAQALPAETPAALASGEDTSLKVHSSRTVPLPDGRRLIIRQVTGLPAPAPESPAARIALPAVVSPSPLSARRADPVQMRLLCVTVTRYAEGISYIEWWPQAGGTPFAAWSNADYEALSTEPEVDVTAAGLYYNILPYFSHRTAQPALPGPVALRLPTEGFLLAKGDPANTAAIAPVAALHQLYKRAGSRAAHCMAGTRTSTPG